MQHQTCYNGLKYLSTKGLAHWTTKVVDLWEKVSWWAKFTKSFSKKKSRLAPWMEESTQNLIALIKRSGLVDYKRSKCVHFVAWRQLGCLWCGA
jgi:hypothetical protein